MAKSSLLAKAKQLKPYHRPNIFAVLPKKQKDELIALRAAYEADELSHGNVKPSLSSLHRLVQEEFGSLCAFNTFRKWMNHEFAE